MQTVRRIKYIGKIEKDKFITDNSMVIICGFGERGRKTLDTLIKKGVPENQIVLCDRRQQNNEKSKYITYEEAARFKSAVFLITNFDVRECAEFLIKRGITDIHIITG